MHKKNYPNMFNIYKRKYIEFDDFYKRRSTTFFQKFFSYQVDFNLIVNINKFSNFNDIYLLSKLVLFNKRNKFVLIISFIFAIFLRVMSWFLFFGFYYLILFILKKYTNFDNGTIYGIYFSLIGPTTILYCLYVYCFVHKKDFPNKSSVRYRMLIDASMQNIKIWYTLKYFYKCKNIVINLKNTKYKEKWNDVLSNVIDTFSNLDLFTYLDVGFYWDKKNNYNAFISKYKKFDLNSKVKSHHTSFIDLIYYFKVSFCALLPTIVCAIVYLIFN